MHVTHLVPAFEDHRGSILDIVQNVPFEHATVITSRAGSVRGNHYHAESTQYVFILSGRVRVTSRMPDALVDTVDTITANPGDLVINWPNERHAVMAIEDSTFLVLTHGPRGGNQYETDTYREDV